MARPFDVIISTDFETYYDNASGFTLKKMTNEEYIRHADFKVHGACLHVLGEDNEAPLWVRGDEMQDYLDQLDWSRAAVLAHNAQFDASILSWVYDVHPCFIFDTLSMARALRGVEVSNSLNALAKFFGLSEKGEALHKTDGLRDLSEEVEQELAEYCQHDVWLCEQIFERLMTFGGNRYPTSELKLIDMTLKMYTEPQLVLDAEMLAIELHSERERRETLLRRLNVTDGDLSSNPKFAEVLRSVGIEPPMKRKNKTKKNPTGEGYTFALAKNDAMFQAILNGTNEDAAELCQARLMVKSTTERTRAQRFIDIASRGTLPVPLNYYGARSGRWTASQKINMQNLKRGSFLRKAIMAPDGYELAVADLSQIEPRVLALLADYEDMILIFKSGGDPYAEFGSQMFNIPGMTKNTHPDLRQSAKSALLGCGYGLGWASFAAQLMVGFLGAPPVLYDKKFAKQLGVTKAYIDRFLDWEDNIDKMEAIPHVCSDEDFLIHCVATKKVIDIYRSTAYPVVAFWELCNTLMHKCLIGGDTYTHKCLTFKKEEIVLPNGMSLLYPNIRVQKNKETKQNEVVYGEYDTKLYAGKITNNVVQGTARIVMTDGMLRVNKRYPVKGTVHDELLALVPEGEAQTGYEWCIEQMVKEPSYLPGIPLAADGGHHRRYGEAKN